MTLEDLMNDFVEEVSYVGPQVPWREMPELDDSPDEPDYEAETKGEVA